MSKDSRDFFPPSGSFQPVVPLSEIAETPDAAEVTPHGPQAKRVAGVVQTGRHGIEEGGSLAPGDEEEETLVPARRRISTLPLATRAGRRKSRLPSWRFIVPCLAAMLVGGVIADAFWRSVRSPARVEDAASVAAGAETTDAEAPPATEEANPPQPQTAPQDSATETSAAPETGGAQRAADDSKTLNAEITSATVVTPPARKRIAAEVSAAESRGKQPSFPARDATDKSAAENRAVRQEPAPRRAPVARSPVLSSSSRDQSLPVFSPPPSDKSGKKDVIQWP